MRSPTSMGSKASWWAMTGLKKKPSTRQPKLTAFTLALNYLPVGLIFAGVLIAMSIPSAGGRTLFAVFWLYLFPPLFCRAVLAIYGRPHGRGLNQEARAYKVWWFLTQFQVIFSRIPWLEEVLRLVPGAYSAWLNLWGSRVSLFAYWAPGARVVDRYLVVVERGAVIGNGSAITGHLGTLATDGSYTVDVASATVEAGAILGANSGLGPGCRIGSNEVLPAGRLLPPFSVWTDGRKIKDGGMEAAV